MRQTRFYIHFAVFISVLLFRPRFWKVWLIILLLSFLWFLGAVQSQKRILLKKIIKSVLKFQQEKERAQTTVRNTCSLPIINLVQYNDEINFKIRFLTYMAQGIQVGSLDPHLLKELQEQVDCIMHSYEALFYIFSHFDQFFVLFLFNFLSLH